MTTAEDGVTFYPIYIVSHEDGWYKILVAFESAEGWSKYYLHSQYRSRENADEQAKFLNDHEIKRARLMSK